MPVSSCWLKTISDHRKEPFGQYLDHLLTWGQRLRDCYFIHFHLLGPGKGRATVTTPALSGEEGKMPG